MWWQYTGFAPFSSAMRPFSCLSRAEQRLEREGKLGVWGTYFSCCFQFFPPFFEGASAEERRVSALELLE